MSSSTSDNSDFAGSDELRKEQSFTGLRDYEAAVDRVIGLALGRIRIFDRRLTTGFNQAERIEALAERIDKGKVRYLAQGELANPQEAATSHAPNAPRARKRA